ncbi:hypothetical protein B9Q04_06330 [Candidatus Marsarchaeota G2 archaeon BE_D]|jgi:hypothetical protein|uniref:Uncharacterized protein n=1 Tax=Candidatus Marsarchaeota G2 archaeon BE_D TaxID=1978158 RepID=A0A2R6CBM3_9ARCH|nr:MAG: hypothetical protein B9Q04_06330 [Candidatus Marsarchaeota G2 archaeon BE_D]
MGYVGGGLGEPSTNQWSKEQFEYQIYTYKLARVALRVFGEGYNFFTGSLAMNTYFNASNRRMVGGVDVVVNTPLEDTRKGKDGGRRGIEEPLRVCEMINTEFEKEGLIGDLELNGVSIKLGLFESVKNTVEGRLRFVALVNGGYMTLKRSCRVLPSGVSKLAYLDGDRSLSDLKVSPIFLDVRQTAFPQKDVSQRLLYNSTLVNTEYINDAARSLGYEPLEISVPSLEYFLASKLNMIYQSSINEGVIRATPLATHHAVKSGRPRVSAVDVYDFVLGARQVSPSSVKRALKPMLVEPMNAMLDMTASALARISGGKYFEELNGFLPANKSFNPEGWRNLCSEALSILKRIRES